MLEGKSNQTPSFQALYHLLFCKQLLQQDCPERNTQGTETLQPEGHSHAELQSLVPNSTHTFTIFHLKTS